MAIERDEIGFDEEWYLRRYPDIAAAIHSGAVGDAWEHFVKIGLNKGRAAFAFDENWYLTTYPDVRRRIQEGIVRSARNHYLQHGRREGRLAVPAGSARRVIAYGSFGSNNVGDEAILEGIKRLYPDCIQIYHNKRRLGNGYLPSQVLGPDPFFQEGDYLILGGGGLLYDRDTVALMTNLAKAALARGAIVDIQRIGCEAAQTEYAKEIDELFELARYVTVRSTMSQEIMERMTEKVYPVEFDFAFNLTEEARCTPRGQNDIPTIGVVTASSTLADVSKLASLIKSHTRAGVKRPIRFVHIPHSRSYFALGNNDCITGEMLWTLSLMHQAADETLFQPWDYDPEPLSVLQKYRNLDGVISSRYHGLIFGQISEIPTLAMGGDLIKLRSYIDDHASDSLFVARNMGDVNDQFGIFLKEVERQRDLRAQST